MDRLHRRSFAQRICLHKKKEGFNIKLKPSYIVAGVTRLELAASCVTGKRSNQLNYTPEYHFTFGGRCRA
jgi:hypothetical protein